MGNKDVLACRDQDELDAFVRQKIMLVASLEPFKLSSQA
jgi:hypothetical protein